jgi:hypothetical protein
VQTHDRIMERKSRDPSKRPTFNWGEPKEKGLWDDYLSIHNPFQNVICVAAHPNFYISCFGIALQPSMQKRARVYTKIWI